MEKLEKGTFGIFPAFLAENLGPYEQLALIWIWYHKNQSGKCWPSYETLADEMKVSRRTVIRAVESLIKKQLLIKTKRRGDKVWTSNEYEVATKCPTDTRGSAPQSPGWCPTVTLTKRSEPKELEPKGTKIKFSGDKTRDHRGNESIKDILKRSKLKQKL